MNYQASNAYSKRKKPIWEGYIHYDSNYIILWKRQNWRQKGKYMYQWSPGVGEEMNKQSTEDF